MSAFHPLQTFSRGPRATDAGSARLAERKRLKIAAGINVQRYVMLSVRGDCRMTIGRILVALICAFGGVACGQAASAPEATATSGQEPVTQASFLAAADALVPRLGTPPGSAGSVPAVTDPAFVRFSAQADAAAELIGTPAFPVTGVETMETLCGVSAKVTVGYLLSGLTSQTRPNMSQAEVQAVTQQVLAANAAKYTDALLPVLIFAVECNAAHFPAFEAFVAKVPAREMTPIRAQGARQVRDGNKNQVSGMLTILSDPALDGATRSKIVNSLARRGDDLASVLNLEQRREFVAQAVPLRASLPSSLAGKFDEFVNAMRRTDCGAMCSL